MRVFIGLTEIAGYYSRLIGGLERAGAKVTFLTDKPHPFGYEREQAPGWLQKWTHHTMDPKEQGFWRNVSKLFLVLYLALTHKAFIFSCASSFNLFRPYGELVLLKLLRRRIVFVMHGSDTRPSFLARYGLRNREGKTVSGHTLLQTCRAQIEKIRVIERYADYVIANPMSAQWHRKPFINWFLIGIPVPEPGKGKVGSRAAMARNPPLILHSPSEPQGKGTPAIRRAIEGLQEKGMELEYLELSGKPHSEVLEALAECSFVIDQLYSDQPMAGFAAEAASFGKASVVGSYGWSELHENAGMGKESYPPVIECEDRDIGDTVEKALCDAASVRSVGEAALSFVENHWSPDAVAGRFIELFHCRPPSEWWFSPADICYYLGCTVRPIEIVIMVRTLLALDSPDCLGLNDKPELKASLISMATEPQAPETEITLTRLVELEKLLAGHEEKLDNFRGMVARRNKRIAALEKKLGIRNSPDSK